MELAGVCLICEGICAGEIEDNYSLSYHSLKKATRQIFKHLLLPFDNFEEITTQTTWKSFCAFCKNIIEDISKNQNKIGVLELQIKHNVEILGKIIAKSTRVNSNSQKSTWTKFKEPVIQNFLLGKLPNPSCKLFLDSSVEKYFLPTSVINNNESEKTQQNSEESQEEASDFEEVINLSDDTESEKQPTEDSESDDDLFIEIKVPKNKIPKKKEAKVAKVSSKKYEESNYAVSDSDDSDLFIEVKKPKKSKKKESISETLQPLKTIESDNRQSSSNNIVYLSDSLIENTCASNQILDESTISSSPSPLKIVQVRTLTVGDSSVNIPSSKECDRQNNNLEDIDADDSTTQNCETTATDNFSCDELDVVVIEVNTSESEGQADSPQLVHNVTTTTSINANYNSENLNSVLQPISNSPIPIEKRRIMEPEEVIPRKKKRMSGKFNQILQKDNRVTVKEESMTNDPPPRKPIPEIKIESSDSGSDYEVKAEKFLTKKPETNSDNMESSANSAGRTANTTVSVYPLTPAEAQRILKNRGNFEVKTFLYENQSYFICPICRKPETDDYEAALNHNWTHMNDYEKNNALLNGRDLPQDLRQTLISTGRDPTTFQFDNTLIAEIIQNQMHVNLAKFFSKDGRVFKCRHCIHQHIREDFETELGVTRDMIKHFLDQHFDRSFTCKFCGQGFSAEQFLVRHYELSHPQQYLQSS